MSSTCSRNSLALTFIFLCLSCLFAAEDKTYEIKQALQSIMYMEEQVNPAIDDLLSQYFARHFLANSKDPLKPPSETDEMRLPQTNLENYEVVNYQSSPNMRPDLRYSWMFSNATSNMTLKNQSVLLDATGKEYIQMDSLFMDLGERQIFIPCTKNNSFKSFSRSFIIESVKFLPFSDSVKLKLFSNSTELEAGQEGHNHTFAVSIVPEKVGDFSSMVLVYFRVRRRDQPPGKSLEKVVPIEVRARITESRFGLKEMERFLIPLERLWTHSIRIYNPLNRNLLIRELSTGKRDLMFDISNEEGIGELHEFKKLVIPPKDHRTIRLSYSPRAIGPFEASLNIKSDEDYFIIIIRIYVLNTGVNFERDFLDFGIIYNRWTLHQIPFKVFNTLNKNYEVVDVILANADTSGIGISYEPLSRSIPGLSKEKTLGYFKMFPINFEKSGSVNGSVYLILNDTNWKPEDNDRKYLCIRTCFGGVYIKSLLSYDQLSFSAFIGDHDPNSTKEKTWPLELASNFWLPIRFKTYWVDFPMITVSSFNSNATLMPGKPPSALMTVAFKGNPVPGTVTIFLNYFGFHIPVFFQVYDAKVEVSSLINSWLRLRISERCTEVCESVFLDFETFSSEERRAKTIQLRNPNPLMMSVRLSDCNSTAVRLELESRTDAKKETSVLKKPLPINAEFKICPFCSFDLNIIARNENPVKETFYIEFSSQAGKHNDVFKVLGQYETINGSLLVPSSSNLRFNPGFPGIVQIKMVSIRSSFEIDCKVLEIESQDPRIIPQIVKAVIPAGTKEEFLKVVFDPSITQRDSHKIVLPEKQTSILTYEDFYFWREYKQYWENIGPSDFKASISIKFDLVENLTINVKGFLKYPSLTAEETLDFGVQEVQTISSRNLTIFNPSDRSLSVMLFLAPDEESILASYAESHFLQNKKSIENNQSLFCQAYEYEPSRKKANPNFKSYEEYISHKPNENPHFYHENEEEKLRAKTQIYSLVNWYRLNFETDQLREFCNASSRRDLASRPDIPTREIPEIKAFSEKEVLETESFLSNLTLLEKTLKYLNSWITPCPEKKLLNENPENQTFFLDRRSANRVFIIPPRSNLTLPVIYKPVNYRAANRFRLLIKNNLTHIYPVKLRGIGGKSEILISEVRTLLSKANVPFFSTQKVTRENDRTVLRFVPHKEEFSPYDPTLSSLPFFLEEAQLPRQIVRFFKVQNMGNFPVTFDRISIEQNGCKAFGFEVRNCQGFSLSPSGHYILEIAFSLDFSQKSAQKTLYLITRKEVLAFTLYVELPFLAGSSIRFVGEYDYYERRMLEGVSAITVLLLAVSLFKSLKYRGFMRRKSRGQWKVLEASDVFELRDQNSVFSFENDIYELRKLRQSVKQTSNYPHSLLFEPMGYEPPLESNPESYQPPEKKAERGEEQGNQGNQGKQEAREERKEEGKEERKSRKKEESKGKKSKAQEKKKNVRKEGAKAKKPKKVEESLKEEEVLIEEKREKVVESIEEGEKAKTEKPEESQEMPMVMVESTKEMSPRLSEDKSMSMSEIVISDPLQPKVLESLPQSEVQKKAEDGKKVLSSIIKTTLSVSLVLEEDPQESTMKLIENAEEILNADKIDSGTIGIIGGRKKKPVEDQVTDEVSSNQDETSGSVSRKQYYDPFSKCSGPPKNESIWHYSLFSSTGNRKNNPPGLSLFSTNRENKYAMFSQDFYGKQQPEEDENEDENEKRWESFEGEKSDSEFSEKSLLQNKLQVSKNPLESSEGKDFAVGLNKENEAGSRFFRTFNFPQSNNPFSLSQLLNPGNEDRSVKWGGMSPGFEGMVERNAQTPSKGLYFGFGEEKPESGQVRTTGQSTESLSRKPPPGFKPNK